MTRRSGTFARSLGCAAPLLLCAISVASAALPPAYQRVREIAAVAAAAAPKLSDPIEVVRQVEPWRYEVRAGACRLEVRIVLDPPKIEPGAVPAPGPRPFAAIPGKPTCR